MMKSLMGPYLSNVCNGIATIDCEFSFSAGKSLDWCIDEEKVVSFDGALSPVWYFIFNKIKRT